MYSSLSIPCDLPLCGPCRNETHRPLPSVCIPERFRMPTVINKAANTQGVVKIQLATRANSLQSCSKVAENRGAPKEALIWLCLKTFNAVDLKLLYSSSICIVVHWNWLKVCQVYLFTALSCNFQKAYTRQEEFSVPALTSLSKLFEALLTCAVFVKVLHSSDSCLSLQSCKLVFGLTLEFMTLGARNRCSQFPDQFSHLMKLLI